MAYWVVAALRRCFIAIVFFTDISKVAQQNNKPFLYIIQLPCQAPYSFLAEDESMLVSCSCKYMCVEAETNCVKLYK